MSEWISIEDRMPIANISVLVSDGDHVGYCYYGHIGWFVSGQNIPASPEPTHWQPLPEPPKEKE